MSGPVGLLVLAVGVIWFALPVVALGALTTVLCRRGYGARSVNVVAAATALLGGFNLVFGPLLFPLIFIGALEIVLGLTIYGLNARQ